MTGTTASRDGDDYADHGGRRRDWDGLVATAVDRGLAGVECLSGIPGTVGGTPIQNVGAYGQEVSSTIEHVTVYDCVDHAVRSMQRGGLRLRVPHEPLQGRRRGAVRRLRRDLPAAPGSADGYVRRCRRVSRSGRTCRVRRSPMVRDAVLSIRRSKGMVVDPGDPDSRSVGSFFMNPVVTEADRERVASAAGERPPGFATSDGRVKIPAAWLIERSGFAKGYADGAVGISTKHPLALVNRGGATAADVLRLARAVKQGVARSLRRLAAARAGLRRVRRGPGTWSF